MKMPQYTIDYHEEDGQWWADSPEIPGYSAWADSFYEVRDLVLEGLAFVTDDPNAVAHERFAARRAPITSRDAYGSVRSLWTVTSGGSSLAAALLPARTAGAPQRIPYLAGAR